MSGEPPFFPATRTRVDDANWRAELAIHFGVLRRKVWGGNRTWAGARAQSVLMSVWRTRWQQGRSALVFLSQLPRGTQVELALPPKPTAQTHALEIDSFAIAYLVALRANQIPADLARSEGERDGMSWQSANPR